ncbi:helix-turn-helix transcriptional regulator [Sphingomonas sp.]|uniref:helix-turn-helix transcriptional regulator n=1 Tax=Sphingomonas sp. TaxID=28214 RepID=UPI0017BDA02C|nr:helix-turn-helix transcriptional regulator [Sphingomonas sp.]MBA4762827.1 helix-turn-helix transcriptional regulator [Sphingomonas sp.]
MNEPTEAHPSIVQDPLLLRRLLRARDRIDAASHEDWPVARLARVSGVSQAHFARAFRQAFGMPPHRYLLTRRVERAAALLRETDASVTDVAFQTGWSSLGSFSRTVRDVTGKTPTQLRAAPAGPPAMPQCYLRAAERPELKMAVSEKRRRAAGITPASHN